MTTSNRLLCQIALPALLVLACGDRQPPAPAVETTGAVVDTVTGFLAPESALHDSVRDVYLVSNINGGATDRDSNGFISRVRPDGAVDSLRFIAGGANGVVLHGPKGLALQGDTLWVADIDVVRGFHAGTGAPLRQIDLTPLGAVFLNDVATGPDGILYISDTGLLFRGDSVLHPGPDRVFMIDAARRPSVVLEGERLARPNGLTWDAENGRLLIAQLGGLKILRWTPGDSVPTTFTEGAGGFDGIEMLGNGGLVVSSLDSSSVLRFENGALRTIVRGLDNPADIGLDRRRLRLLIPSFSANNLIIRSLPGASPAP